MKSVRSRLSRRDAALVAAALLIPIPVFAQTGLSIPLPGIVERSLGPVAVEAGDERAGAEATGQASGESRTERRTGSGSLRITRGRGALTVPGTTSTLRQDGNPVSADTGGDTGSEAAGARSGGSDTPAGGDPDGAGGGGGTGSSGDGGNGDSGGGTGGGTDSGTGGADTGGSSDDGGQDGGIGGSSDSDSGSDAVGTRGTTGSDARPRREPGLTVTASGEGTTSGATADTDGLGVDVLANDSGGGDPQVGVEITDQDGSTTGVTVTVPVGGVTVP